MTSAYDVDTSCAWAAGQRAPVQAAKLGKRAAVVNEPTLAECYKVAALDTSNTLRL